MRRLPERGWKSVNAVISKCGSRLSRLVMCVTALAVLCALASPVAVAAQVEPGSGPTPPTGLEVFDRQEDLGLRVTLSWSHRPECAAYHVYRSERVDGTYEFAGGISAGTMESFPFFLDDGAAGGKTYYYRVSALDGSLREGALSEPVRADPPGFRRSAGVGKSMVCSIGDQRVYFFENDVIVNILRCSTGAGGTPTGNYRILAHRGTVSGCPYWMDWKPNYGMHSWPSYLGAFEENLGVTPRSHGCIRLHPLEASWAYYWAHDGTPLNITYASLGRLPLQGASCSAGATAPSPTWYFAEGFTGGEFLEYLLLFNPGATEVNAKTTYYPENAPPVTEFYNVPPGARKTVFVNGVSGLPASSHATKVEIVEEDGWLVAEQAEYFNYGGRRGGHSSVGAAETSREWYFAEGYTGGMFDSYLLLFNPGEKYAKTAITFYPEGGPPVVQEYVLPPFYRGTILENAVPGLAGVGVSCKVTSESPVVAARTVYFVKGSLPNGINGGDYAIGIEKPSKTWYLAEGCTAGFFDTYILVLNPGQTTANVNVILYPDTGPYGYQFQVAPNSRGTLSVDSIPGLENANTGATITSDTDIVVERAVYCSRDSRRGGHVSTGIAEPSADWYFAEGYTGGTFDQYVLLLNPGDEPTTANFVFHTEGGADIGYACVVPPKRRLTVHVDEIPGVEWTGNAFEIHCDRPVVAERSQYFCIPR